MTVTPKRRHADWSKWPFVVSLRDLQENPWTGSIIGPHHVLTAAHCVVNPDRSVARRQDTFISVLGESAERTGCDIEQICGHPDYRFSKKDGMMCGFKNDIAIIAVKDPLPRPHLRCLSIAAERHYSDRTAVTQVGFGGDIGTKNVGWRKSDGDFLRYRNSATDFYNETTLATRTRTCDGDSGGPLLVAREDVDARSPLRWVQIGVTSQGGDECGAIDNMGACVRTARKEIFDWICGFTPQ